MDNLPHRRELGLDESTISAILVAQLAKAIVEHPDFETLTKLGWTPRGIIGRLESYVFAEPSPPPAPSAKRDAPLDVTKLTARAIREAIVCMFGEYDLGELRLGAEAHKPIVAEMIERFLPELSGIPIHKRNRIIIDACAGRKFGPVLQSRSGKRYIVLR